MRTRIIFLGLTSLFMIFSGSSFSQDQKDQKTQIKPALLVTIILENSGN